MFFDFLNFFSDVGENITDDQHQLISAETLSSSSVDDDVMC